MTNKNLKLFIHLFKSKNTIETVLSKDIKKYGLSLSEFGVLEYLYFKGESTVQTVCDKLLVQSSAMTYIASKLEEKGFLKRTTDQNDRRRILLNLTKKGSNFITSIFPEHEKMINQIFSELEENEKVVLSSLLKRVGLHAKGMIKHDL